VVNVIRALGNYAEGWQPSGAPPNVVALLLPETTGVGRKTRGGKLWLLDAYWLIAEDCQFSMKITPDSKREGRYRWAIYREEGKAFALTTLSLQNAKPRQRQLQRRRSMWWVSK
jgi:hypothetical protein